jgi:hypothetical protein
MKNTYSKRKGVKKAFEVYRDIDISDEKPSKNIECPLTCLLVLT